MVLPDEVIFYSYIAAYTTYKLFVAERIIVVSEYYSKSINKLTPPVTPVKIRAVAKEILLGLSYLNDRGIVHRALSPDNILIDAQENVKLFNYGLYFMSYFGKSISFPIGNPKYTPPEVYLAREKNASGPKVDVWSLGIILAELALNKVFWCDLKLNQIIRRVLTLLNCSGTVFEHLANEHNCNDAYKALPPDLRDFINKCLQTDLEDRDVPKDLLKSSFFETQDETNEEVPVELGYNVGFLQRVSAESVKTHLKSKKETAERNVGSNKCFHSYEEYSKKYIKELSERSLKERYYLWHLAGGDVYSELKKQGMIKSKPPILTLPK